RLPGHRLSQSGAEREAHVLGCRRREDVDQPHRRHAPAVARRVRRRRQREECQSRLPRQADVAVRRVGHRHLGDGPDPGERLLVRRLDPRPFHQRPVPEGQGDLEEGGGHEGLRRLVRGAGQVCLRQGLQAPRHREG
ncbi:unnamed protein product, partial [Prorocentrum cordatum]